MGYWFMSLTKTKLILLALPLCAFSFAAGGMAAWLAGESEGRALYQVARQVYTEKAAEDELLATLSIHPNIKPDERALIQQNSNFRAAFLRSRYNGDILAALAEERGLLSTPEAEAWLRIAVREAIKQFCMSRMTSAVTVTSNEIVEYYDANSSALAHLSFENAIVWAEERLLQERRQEALLGLVHEAERTLPARCYVTNW